MAFAVSHVFSSRNRSMLSMGRGRHWSAIFRSLILFIISARFSFYRIIVRVGIRILPRESKLARRRSYSSWLDLKILREENEGFDLPSFGSKENISAFMVENDGPFGSVYVISHEDGERDSS